MKLDGYEPRRFLTITELDTFARCPRKYFYSAGCGLRKVAVEGESGGQAMFFGTCIHKAIGRYFSTWDYSASVACFEEEWKETVGDERRNKETARMMLLSFCQNHPKGGGLYEPLPPPQTNISIDKGDKISDWEIPFALDIGLPVPLLGRIDGWCRSRHTGQKRINEFKTSYEISDRLLKGFRRSPQILGYTLAARSSGEEISGAYLEVLRSSNRQWQTELLSIDVPDFELERFVAWAKIMGQAILDCEAAGDWPQYPTGCHPYAMFGIVGYLCEFDPLCSVTDWTQMKQFYNVERHVPYIMPTIGGKELSHA